ncbi:MAG: hypothetical protein WCL39_12630, partial [Armatimonadota bacterium]
GDSLTEGLDSSGPAYTFRQHLLDKLQAAHPSNKFTQRVVFGVTDSRLAGMIWPVKNFAGPWPNAVVIQDAVTGHAQLDEGTVTQAATVRLSVTNGTASGITIVNPGTGYQLHDSVYFDGISVVGGQGIVSAVGPAGEIQKIDILDGGLYYASDQLATITINSYIGSAKAIVNDILTRWTSNGQAPPLIFFCNCWQQPNTLIEYPKGSGKLATWNSHFAAVWDQPAYCGKVIPVDIDSLSNVPGNRGVYRMANCDGGTRWDFTWPLDSDLNGKELYLLDSNAGAPFISKIISSGPNYVITKEPRGLPRANITISLGQDVRWSLPNRIGDCYHPSNAGHEAIAQTIFTAMEAAASKTNR